MAHGAGDPGSAPGEATRASASGAARWVDRTGPRPLLRLLLVTLPVVPLLTGAVFYVASGPFNAALGIDWPAWSWALLGAVAFAAVGLVFIFSLANSVEVRRLEATASGVTLQFYGLRGKVVPLLWVQLHRPTRAMAPREYLLRYSPGHGTSKRTASISREQCDALESVPDRPAWMQ